MKKLLLTVVGIFVIQIAQATKIEPEVFNKCVRSVILIKSEDEQTSGTGFVVKSKKIDSIQKYLNVAFSCEHIIKNKYLTINLSLYDQNKRLEKYYSTAGMVLAKEYEEDFSILIFLTEFPVDTVDVDFNYIPEMTDKVFMVSHGLGEDARFTDGSILTANPNSEFIKTSVTMIFGDSGAPLFHGKKVIGIANGMKSMAYGKNKIPLTNISLFKSVRNIKTFLEKCGLYDPVANNNNNNLPEIAGMFLWAKSLKELQD